MERYYLHSDVHVSFVPDGTILQDFRNGKYLGLSQQQTLALSKIVHGWPPAPESAQQESHTDKDLRDLAHSLAEQKVLTRIAARGKITVAPLELEPPTAPLLEPDVASTPRIRPHHIFNLLVAFLAVFPLFKIKPLRSTLRSISKHRDKNARRMSPDLNDLRYLVSIFNLLRPLLYRRKYHCLLDCLVLVRFLGRYRKFPRVVFGVRSGPFAAHAWVQEEGYVLNDLPELVRSYSPIFVA